MRVMAKLLLLLAPLSVFSAVSGQCSEDTCTKLCIPNVWERDLCKFYQEIATWYNSAVQCGLSVDPVPVRLRTFPPEEQWEQARRYWEHLRAVWTDAAIENGVFGPQNIDVPSVPPPMATDSPTSEMLTPFPTEMDGIIGSGFSSGLTSGMQPTTEMPTDPPTEESTTSPPPTSNDPLTLQDVWLSGIQSWENDFAQWESFTRSESGLRLPESVSGGIVRRLKEGGSDNERANSATWFELLTDWNEGFSIYNGTFIGVCYDR